MVTVPTAGARRAVRIDETVLLLVLCFASGVAALIYEVLWSKELGRLFGVTAHATAATLAVFFGGLAAGGLVWGRRASRMAHPLRTYGLLELVTALSALLYFFILDLYHGVYASLFAAYGDRPLTFLAIKLGLAFVILFPPAFFMGGTLPVMGQHMIRQAGQLGLRASQLYAANTVGAALGAFLAGFSLPVVLGFRNTYAVAMALNLLIGAVALLRSRSGAASPVVAPLPAPTPHAAEPRPAMEGRPALVWTTAVVSGFTTLGLEVLWVRMFGQVLQNSVYTFSALLTVFLGALALGSVLAHALCRRRWPPWTVLFALLCLSGALVGSTPWVFYQMTSGLQSLGGAAGWSGYVGAVFLQVAAVVIVPGAVIGSVFPYLMKLSEEWTESPGRTMGQLAAANTAAAIAGSLVAGFVLLDALGLWASIRLMAIVYLGLALLVLPGASRATLVLRTIPAAGIVLLGLVFTYSDFAAVRVESARGEQVVQVWEGSDGTVAVVRAGDNLRMKYNNDYALGDSGAALLHRRHTWIPLSLHPDPGTVFYLGMGTGISAGAALDFPLSLVVVSEISPAIVAASRAHFAPYLFGLFEDPRVRILPEDGRSYLYGTSRQYDVIIADLFLPWKAGTGSLYSKEHFETVRARLAPGALFAQWLPMAQIGRREFGMVARTMLEVFPQVTVWRRGFSLETPALALIAQSEIAPLDNAAFEGRIEELRRIGRIKATSWLGRLPQAAYAGNLTAARSSFARFPLNTDDRPLVEYLAPVSHREAAAGRSTAFTGDELAALYASFLDSLPPKRDPYLVALDPERTRRVQAGRELWAHLVSRRAGRAAEARVHLEAFQRLSGTIAR